MHIDRGMSAWRSAVTLLLAACLSVGFLLVPGCSSSTRNHDAVEQVVPETQPEAQATAVAVDPLDGEAVEDAGLINRRVLAVKIENDPAARPQSGISDAEVVIEELVEGGITRFICLFLAHESPALGPNRSVRPTDIDILYFLQPLLICSGGAPQVMAMVKSSGLMYLEEDATHFWRDRKRTAPHNLYTNTQKLRQYLEERGDGEVPAVVSGLEFVREGDEAAEADGEGGLTRTVIPATTIEVPYESGCAVRYRYDPARGTYLRFVQGKPHTDLNNGAQLAPRNVILQYVQLTSSGVKDVLGAESPNAMVVGRGRCAVFTGGEVIVGTWVKNDRNQATRYYDLLGREIGLNPGQTWIHLVPNELKTTFMP